MNKSKSEENFIVHETDIVINRDRLRSILDYKGMEHIDLYNQIVFQFGLHLTYKGFMSILSGKATWKLLYAYALLNVLEIEIKDVFELVEVDVETVKKEKTEQKSRYQINQ